MDQVNKLVGIVKPYDISAGKWLQAFGVLGTVGAVLLAFIIFVTLKLRLLSKLGLYLGGVGIGFLALGVALLFNTPLLIIGNVFILAGLVFVVGFERTGTYYEIFKTNMCCGRGLAWAGFVIFLSGLLSQLITKLPIVGRLYKWIPFVKNIVESETDDQLWDISRCSNCWEPEPEPWSTPGRLRSSRSSRKAD